MNEFKVAALFYISIDKLSTLDFFEQISYS